jgi:hypothetical protein
MTDDEKTTYYRAKAESLREMAKQLSLREHQSEMLRSAAECDQRAIHVDMAPVDIAPIEMVPDMAAVDVPPVKIS